MAIGALQGAIKSLNDFVAKLERNIATNPKLKEIELKVLKQFIGIGWVADKVKILTLENDIKLLQEEVKKINITNKDVQQLSDQIKQMKEVCKSLKKEGKSLPGYRESSLKRMEENINGVEKAIADKTSAQGKATESPKTLPKAEALQPRAEEEKPSPPLPLKPGAKEEAATETQEPTKFHDDTKAVDSPAVEEDVFFDVEEPEEDIFFDVEENSPAQEKLIKAEQKQLQGEMANAVSQFLTQLEMEIKNDENTNFDELNINGIREENARSMEPEEALVFVGELLNEVEELLVTSDKATWEDEELQEDIVIKPQYASLKKVYNELVIAHNNLHYSIEKTT